jgi:hypothetical protein
VRPPPAAGPLLAEGLRQRLPLCAAAMPRVRLVLATLLLALPLGAHAQSLTAGTRVRVATPEDRQIGYVERVTADSLVLAHPGHERTAVAWSEAGRTEYSLGRRGNPGRGALVGAGVLGTLTAVSFALSSEDLQGYDSSYYVSGVTVGALFGAGVGALAGLAWRTERWATLPIGTGRASAPEFGPGLTLTVRL